MPTDTEAEALPFELEHWKSRALVAEQERDSARNVLAALRGYFHGDARAPVTQERVRESLRQHDQTWWTREHAVNAVAEFFAGVTDD